MLEGVVLSGWVFDRAQLSTRAGQQLDIRLYVFDNLFLGSVQDGDCLSRKFLVDFDGIFVVATHNQVLR